MTSEPRAASRVLGSLRSADGKGVVRMQDRYDTDIDDLWSGATCASAASTAFAFMPADRKAPGGSRSASPRGTCW
jgi:hypothetical protein